MTGTAISGDSLSLLQLLFVSLSVCLAAGLLNVDLGLELSYSSVSNVTSCLAFGPFIWLFIILYVIFAFTSTDLLLPGGDSDGGSGSIGGEIVSGDSGNYLNLGQSEREVAGNVLSLFFGCLLAIISILWLVDILTDSYILTVKRRWSSLFVASMCGLYGGCVITSAVPAVYSLPTSFFYVNGVFLRILEVCVVAGCMVFLWEKMAPPLEKKRPGGGVADRSVSYPIMYRGVSPDPWRLDESRRSPYSRSNSYGHSSSPRSLFLSPQFPYTNPSPQHPAAPVAGTARGAQWTAPRILPPAASKNVSAQAGHRDFFYAESFSPGVDDVSSCVSEMEDEVEWRLRGDAPALLSPPLVPTSSTLPPPRPPSLPRPSLPQRHLSNSSSMASEVSAETFPLPRPLWSLG